MLNSTKNEINKFFNSINNLEEDREIKEAHLIQYNK